MLVSFHDYQTIWYFRNKFSISVIFALWRCKEEQLCNETNIIESSVKWNENMELAFSPTLSQMQDLLLSTVTNWPLVSHSFAVHPSSDTGPGFGYKIHQVNYILAIDESICSTWLFIARSWKKWAARYWPKPGRVHLLFLLSGIASIHIFAPLFNIYLFLRLTRHDPIAFYLSISIPRQNMSL